jgi:photosystem II stability/assembly factor-like uncharacterized protein
LDAKHGWVAAIDSADPTQPLAFSTVDGGATWSRATLGASDTLYDSGWSADFSFSNTDTGWVLLTLATSSNFSSGRLLETTDGGASWAELAAPSGGQVAFSDSHQGWIAENAASGRLFQTSDSGSDWTDLAPISATPQGPPFYGLPAVGSSGVGLLDATVASSGTTAILKTDDDGATWTQTTSVDLPPIESGVAPITLATSSEWVLFAPDASEIIQLDSSGTATGTVTPSGLPADSSVLEVSFSDPSDGWAVVAASTCPDSKSSCTTSQALYATADGGQSWSRLTV